MQDLVDNALKHKEEENKIEEYEKENDGMFEPRIVVIGCGGAGNNTINRLQNVGVEGAETIAINTDKQDLEINDADTKILVGKSSQGGMGAGGEPSVGRKCTKGAEATIKEAIGDADMVFVTAGMGGGTGTGAAPVVADIASKKGAVVMSMVSTPFDLEKARVQKAREGLEKLRKKSDSVIVLDNNRLLSYVPDLPMGDAFSVMDQIISETVKGISETITQPSLINLDYADMRNIMDSGGVAVMLIGETENKNNIQEAVDDAMNHALLDVDYRGASGGLVHITGGPNLTLREANDIADGLTNRLDPSAQVIWGARIQEKYKGKARVMAIMTGVESPQLLNSTSAKKADKASGSTPRSDRNERGQQSQTQTQQHGGRGSSSSSGSSGLDRIQ